MDPKATDSITTNSKPSVPQKTKPKFGLDGKDYRKTGDRFTFAQALSIFSKNVEGKTFHYKDFMKSMEVELERGTMKTKIGDNGDMIFWFEPLHPINKYPELETLSTLSDDVKTEKINFKKL